MTTKETASLDSISTSSGLGAAWMIFCQFTEYEQWEGRVNGTGCDIPSSLLGKITSLGTSCCTVEGMTSPSKDDLEWFRSLGSCRSDQGIMLIRGRSNQCYLLPRVILVRLGTASTTNTNTRTASLTLEAEKCCVRQKHIAVLLYLTIQIS